MNCWAPTRPSQRGAKLTIPVPTISNQTQAVQAADRAVPPHPQRLTPSNKAESLGSIATKYGVTVEAIKAINSQISNPNLIYVGQVIVIL